MTDETRSSLSELLNTPPEDATELNIDTECVVCGSLNDKDAVKCSTCGASLVLPTLGEYGKKLPIGVPSDDGKTLDKQFDMKPLSWKIEREIGKSWETNAAQLNLGDYIGTILAHTVTRIGQTDITKYKLDKKLLIFSQMFMGDVFYLYAYLRLISIGKQIHLRKLKCFKCDHQFPFYGDLTTIDVITFENQEGLERPIKLRDGFEMGGDHRDTLKIRPALWNSTRQKSGINRAEMFMTMMSNSVSEIEGLPRGTVMGEQEFEQFTKYDMELCMDELNRVVGGPRWMIEIECPKCKTNLVREISWEYDNFFVVSSR